MLAHIYWRNVGCEDFTCITEYEKKKKNWLDTLIYVTTTIIIIMIKIIKVILITIIIIKILIIIIKIMKIEIIIIIIIKIMNG